jgi:cardiolipin synthase
MVETWILVFAIAGMLVPVFTFLVAFFHPGLDYRITTPTTLPVDSPDFARLVALVTDSEARPGSAVQVLTNGPTFYEDELDAIRQAKTYICLEAYIFQKGVIASRIMDALIERARAGVEVRIVLDAIGSFNTWRHNFAPLIQAGGRVSWYNAFRWYNLPRVNNRTHRELLIVDGVIGYIGGAGIADHWWKSRGKRRIRWRDTMFRVEGPAVTALVSMFAENWLESSGELLTDPKYYPELPARGDVTSFVINSTPSFGRGSRARMLFQLLIASATRSIHITTPYFLPDRGALQELIRASVERRVQIKILVPGKHNDHLLTRRSSRRLYGGLLANGAQIYEYRPSMIHNKTMVVDGIWSVVGSTNFDHRSFGINDEVNLAAANESLAARLDEDFHRDLAHSHLVSYAEWEHRSPLERLHEWLGWVLERQE